MADDDDDDDDEHQKEDIPSHPFFVRAEFPFVFIPRTNFTFDNNRTNVIDGDNQRTTEFLNEKETNEAEEESGGEILEDEGDRSEMNIEEKNDVRISQPKYSKLLKDLDFSRTRMVDVTNLLSDEGGNYLTPDENENPKKFSGDEKYQSLPSDDSSVSTDEAIARQSPSNIDIEDENLTNAANEIQNDLNNLAAIIQDASQIPIEGNPIDNTQKKHHLDEDDDTSKQATQNYDLNDIEQEDIGATSKSDKNIRFTTQEENISSIPRLNTSASYRIELPEEYPISRDNLVNESDGYTQQPNVFIISQTIPELHTTPTKEQEPVSPPKEKTKQHVDSSSKQNLHYRSRQLSSSSDADSPAEHVVHRIKQKQRASSQPHLSADEDFEDLNTHLKQVLLDGDQPQTTANDILIRRLSDRTSPNKKKSHHRSSTANDTWLAMLEKLEREHKERLEKQQKQYEDYMKNLEAKMKQRFDEYLSTTNSLQESKSEILDESIHLRRAQYSAPIDLNPGRYRTSSSNYQYRPLAKDLNLSRSQSREDISTLRTELSTKHAKHISDLKLYYEHEIDELKNQLARSRMGHASSTTRQSIETIERINNENINLHDEMKELRNLLKKNEEDNRSLKRQVEELREQLNRKDLEMKNYYRGVTDLEKQLQEAQTIKERQDEKTRYADRQALIYREENEKITNELNLTRERLLHLEERYRDLENESKTHRSQGSTTENHHLRTADDLKLSSTMALNMPTSREYGRFTLTTSKYSSSTISASKETNLDSGRYTTNGTDDLFRHDHSPRPLVKITDYINEKPTFPQAYVPPSRPLYSPRKSDQMPVRDFIDNQMKQSEQLEQKFDDLLRKKRDLESRINRIPTRGLSNTDRQLLDVLEREIERVEQQISSVKLELRKMNILRTH